MANIKKKKSRKKKIILFGFAAILLYLAIGSEYNLLNLWLLKQEESALETQIKASELEQKRLQTEIEKLNTDSTYIERIAREKHKMGVPGEKIFIFQNGKEN